MTCFSIRRATRHIFFKIRRATHQVFFPDIRCATHTTNFQKMGAQRPKSFFKKPRNSVVPRLIIFRTSNLVLLGRLSRFLRSNFFFLGGRLTSSTVSPCKAVPDEPLASAIGSSLSSTKTFARPCFPKNKTPWTLILPTEFKLKVF